MSVELFDDALVVRERPATQSNAAETHWQKGHPMLRAATRTATSSSVHNVPTSTSFCSETSQACRPRRQQTFNQSGDHARGLTLTPCKAWNCVRSSTKCSCPLLTDFVAEQLIFLRCRVEVRGKTCLKLPEDAIRKRDVTTALRAMLAVDVLG